MREGEGGESLTHLSSVPIIVNWSSFTPQETFSNAWNHFSCHHRGMVLTPWVEARDATAHPTICKMASHNKDSASSKCQCAKAEKCCSGLKQLKDLLCAEPRGTLKTGDGHPVYETMWAHTPL